MNTKLNSQRLQVLMTHFPALTSLSMFRAFDFEDLTWLIPVRDTLHVLKLRLFPTPACAAEKLLFLQQLPHLSSLTLDGAPHRSGWNDFPLLDKLHVQALIPPSRILPQLTHGNYHEKDYDL